jgi:hypothetical protein
MLAQKCMYSFLDGKIRNQLVWFECLTGHRVKLPHLCMNYEVHKFDMSKHKCFCKKLSVLVSVTV